MGLDDRCSDEEGHRGYLDIKRWNRNDSCACTVVEVCWNLRVAFYVEEVHLEGSLDSWEPTTPDIQDRYEDVTDTGEQCSLFGLALWTHILPARLRTRDSRARIRTCFDEVAGLIDMACFINGRHTLLTGCAMDAGYKRNWEFKNAMLYRRRGL